MLCDEGGMRVYMHILVCIKCIYCIYITRYHKSDTSEMNECMNFEIRL